MKNKKSELQVPHPVVLLHGQGVSLSCAPDGSLSQELSHGLFAGDTRMLSTYRYSLSGCSWDFLGRSSLSSSSQVWIYQNPKISGPYGEIPAATLLLRIKRSLEGTLRDDLEIYSFAKEAVSARLYLELSADFSDIFEVRDNLTWARLNVCRVTHTDGFTLSYEQGDFRRAIDVRFSINESAPNYSNGKTVFDLRLAPKSIWKCSVHIVPRLGSASGPTPVSHSWIADSTILTSSEVLQAPYDRGISDLDDLTVKTERQPPYLAAGVPWFSTLFGRDTLVAGMMSSLSGGDRLDGALSLLTPLQAEASDDWRDAEPGKLPHEVRMGELTQSGILPFSPYYGGHDIPALYCLGLWNSWRWRGDRNFLEKNFPTAKRALHWCEKLGDRDGDGFLEYGTRSAQGYFNQSWKDSGEAIVHADGSLPKLPLATVEMQGYFYAALRAMSELTAVMGDRDESSRLSRLAEDLRQLVEGKFWMEDLGFYATGLDGDKRQIRSISSNPSHLLWCGLPSPERANRVANRLLREDLFSGWGLRTLSSEHVSYNPLAYQLGSVWPHDTALAAAGLQRYGAIELFHKLSHSLLDAANQFEREQLPELFGGLDRADGLPMPYGRANIPQAWAAASPVLLAQLFLGLVPDAPQNRVFLNPRLPDWLPKLELSNITIGREKIAVKLSRRDGRTIIDEIENNQNLQIVTSTEKAPLWGDP